MNESLRMSDILDPDRERDRGDDERESQAAGNVPPEGLDRGQCALGGHRRISRWLGTRRPRSGRGPKSICLRPGCSNDRPRCERRPRLHTQGKPRPVLESNQGADP